MAERVGFGPSRPIENREVIEIVARSNRSILTTGLSAVRNHVHDLHLFSVTGGGGQGISAAEQLKRCATINESWPTPRCFFGFTSFSDKP
jgi:hypothetical protein